ncbi:MAG: dimethylarginine dimethylaminohydrolase family protein [Actinomycetota bacterium]
MSIQDPVAPLRRVYVRAPEPGDLVAWREYGWRSEPDPARAVAEHAAFRAELRRSGAEVVVGGAPVPGDPDAIYTYDPVLATDAGAILLRPGKEGRRPEPAAARSDLLAFGIPIAGSLTAPATAEGGDLLWLDGHTLLAGRGYRTNDEGIAQLRGLLGSAIEVIAFDLPHHRGPEVCLHLLSLVSPLDVDLVVGFPPLLPVRLLDLLRERSIRLLEVPDEEFDTMGPNVLALGPRVALALDGNPRTRERMESAGVDVRIYVGEEISRKGDGGPTCLTRPLQRG